MENKEREDRITDIGEVKYETKQIDDNFMERMSYFVNTYDDRDHQ